MSYVDIAREVLRTAMTGSVMQGVAVLGTYARVIAPTPQAPSTTQTASVWVFFERYNGRPVADVPWQPADRKALIQQADVADLGIPQREDQLRMDDATYHVIQCWEEAPGLLWALQVRP